MGTMISMTKYVIIIKAMKKNTLIHIYLQCTSISGECARRIVKALQHNNTLQWLTLNYHYPEDVKERIKLLVKEVNEKRESRNCKVKLRVRLYEPS